LRPSKNFYDSLAPSRDNIGLFCTIYDFLELFGTYRPFRLFWDLHNFPELLRGFLEYLGLFRLFWISQHYQDILVLFRTSLDVLGLFGHCRTFHDFIKLRGLRGHFRTFHDFSGLFKTSRSLRIF
jgi:hypothetical protein